VAVSFVSDSGKRTREERSVPCAFSSSKITIG
jgi:hypothetical protein